MRSNLTLNLGVRWDLMQYWSEKYNQIPTFVLGQQSKVFPTAPRGLVYPTDSGIPNTLVPQGNPFSPRIGLAYSPSKADGMARQDHWRAGKNQHPRGIWNVLFRDSRQHHRH